MGKRNQIGCVGVALGAPRQMCVEHPALELRQLVVESKGNLRPNALAYRWSNDPSHDRCDDTGRKELDGLAGDRFGRLLRGQVGRALHRRLTGEVERIHDLGEVARDRVVTA